MTSRIAIVGAGAAGLAAAARLRQLGYEHVHVFEKRDRVGGKCSTVDIEGRSYEMGAVVVGMTTYHVVLSLVREHGLTLLPASKVGLIDVDKGGVLTGLELAKAYLTRARPALKKFLVALQDMPSHRETGYLSFDKDAFGKTFMEWAREHGHEGIEELIAPGYVGWGYQYLEKVGAAYVFKLYDYERTKKGFSYRPFQGSPMQVIKEGYQTLWERVAAPMTVHTGIAIQKIERSDVITIRTDRGDFEYDELILACPLDTIGEFLDVRPEEASLFGKIDILNLHTFTCRVDGMRNDDIAFFVSNLTEDKMGRPVGAYKRWRDSNIWVFYSLGDDTQDEATLHDLLRTDLEACGASIEESLAHDCWRYFPHVSPADFKAGFYEQIEAVNGKNKTYLTGEIMGFSSVEGVASYSYALVDRFFSNRA